MDQFYFFIAGLILASTFAGIFLHRQKISQKHFVQQLKDKLQINETKVFSLSREIEVLKENALKAENLENALREKNLKSETMGARLLAEKVELERRLKNQTDEQSETSRQMQEKFENLANKILDQKSAKFTEINKENLKNVLQPLDKDIREFRKKVEDLHEKETSQYAALREFLGNLHKSQAKLSEEAHNLTQALKGDSKKQGDWGEFILQRALEASGLTKDQEFSMQSSFDGKRPDAIIHLPGKRQLIIDSKVSLTAYEKSISAETEDERKKARKEHLQSLRKHIDELSAKDYSSIEDLTCPDFTLMFIPVEPAFGAALAEDSELYQYAFDRKIALITASTLMATIKTVANLWKLEKQNKHAQDVAKRAGLLYDKFAGFLLNMEEMGKSLQKAIGAHEKAVGQLSTGPGNLIGQAEKLKSMGVRTKKDIPSGFLHENEQDLEQKEQAELSFSKDSSDGDNRQSA